MSPATQTVLIVCWVFNALAWARYELTRPPGVPFTARMDRRFGLTVAVPAVVFAYIAFTLEGVLTHS